MKAIGSVHVDRTVICLELLASRPRTVAELASCIGSHPRTVRRTLDRLVYLGYVARSPVQRKLFIRTPRLLATGLGQQSSF
jgi:DNA-binding IclR family transcriptional regulator